MFRFVAQLMSWLDVQLEMLAEPEAVCEVNNL